MKRNKTGPRFVLCVQSDDDSDLTLRKLYEAWPDPKPKPMDSCASPMSLAKITFIRRNISLKSVCRPPPGGAWHRAKTPFCTLPRPTHRGHVAPGRRFQEKSTMT